MSICIVHHDIKRHHHICDFTSNCTKMNNLVLCSDNSNSDSSLNALISKSLLHPITKSHVRRWLAPPSFTVTSLPKHVCMCARTIQYYGKSTDVSPCETNEEAMMSLYTSEIWSQFHCKWLTVNLHKTIDSLNKQKWLHFWIVCATCATVVQFPPILPSKHLMSLWAIPNQLGFFSHPRFSCTHGVCPFSLAHGFMQFVNSFPFPACPNLSSQQVIILDNVIISVGFFPNGDLQTIAHVKVGRGALPAPLIYQKLGLFTCKLWVLGWVAQASSLLNSFKKMFNPLCSALFFWSWHHLSNDANHGQSPEFCPKSWDLFLFLVNPPSQVWLTKTWSHSAHNLQLHQF